MAKLSFSRKIQTIIVIDISDTNYYHPYAFDIEPWEKLKTILSQFGIILSSPYELEFANDEYLIKPVPGLLGETAANVLYKGKVIAKGSVEGSNFCDEEGELTIYMDVLKSIYEAK